MKSLTQPMLSRGQAVNLAMRRLAEAQKLKAQELAAKPVAQEVAEKPRVRPVAPPRRKDGTFEGKLAPEEVQKTLRDLGVYRTI